MIYYITKSKLLITVTRERENDLRTDNLTNNRRLFNCDKRRIEKHQLLITSLHSQQHHGLTDRRPIISQRN